MAFTRVRTIKKKQYLYREERWREGKRVCSRSTFLGPVEAQSTSTFGVDWDAIEREELARMDKEDAARAQHLQQLHDAYGLKLGPADPVPEDKPAPAHENASPDGEAEVSETPDQ